METANVTYQDESGNIKVKIDHDKCITCGLCVSACKHDARSFSDDTERLFDDLSKGTPISFIAAPSIKTNLPEYKKLLKYLKSLGANKIYDVSLGADICIWAHVRYIQENGISPMITQPCPAIVSYCELYRHDLIKRLSPIHSPMACTSIYMKEYQGINDRIAALSPCIAKTNEFESTKLADYNITFSKLIEYLTTNNIKLPDEETDFDHPESGLGSLFPMPGGFKENLEYFMGKNLHVAKAEGFNIYEKLDKYAHAPEEFLPDIYDVLNCAEGCNIGTASLHDRCLFEIDKTMNAAGKKAADERKKKHYESIYSIYDDTLDLTRFIRKYRTVPINSQQITDADIGKAFETLGKLNYEQQHIDCFACGSKTCYDMARKIALNINIPNNCIVKVMEDAKAEHEENLLAHAQLASMEKMREADERMRTLLEINPQINFLFDNKFNIIDCNPAATAFMGFESKEETLAGFVARVAEGIPEYQPDGRKSIPLFERFAKTIKDGHVKFETELTVKGTKHNLDVEFKKIPHEDSFAIVGFVYELTELKNLIHEAERQRMEAEAANKAKSVFLSHISHEIRTPMNAILGTAEIQLQKEDTSPENEEAFNMVYSSGNLLLNIINDILDLSKIEAGKLEIILEKYDIPSIIYDTVQLILLRYDSKPINFILKIDENTPLDLIGDELRIKQVLNNILSNAFKYTEKGTVELSVSAEILDDSTGSKEKENCILVLRVSDTGLGMTEEQVERLFEEYTRFNMDANRTIVGTGLGMHITKRLIDAMGGEITVESKLDRGSVFTVRLPQERIGRNVCGIELAEQLRSNRFKGTLKTGRTQIVREYMPYGSVLVVDDVESNLYVARGIMLPYGLKIETVSSGFGAVNKVKAGEKYDIIFMDHMMPTMNGIDTTKIIREMGYVNPIIALTANAVAGSSAMFLENGFDAFMSKPIDIRELNTLLNRLIRDKQSPEVIKAARKQLEQQKPVNESNRSVRTKKDYSIVVVRDIKKALIVLEDIIHKIYNDGDVDINLFTTTVHGMKSALLNIEESDLSAAALKLEQAGAAREIAEIAADTPVFMSALRAVIEKHSPKEQDQTDETSEENKVYLIEKLSEIKSACKHVQKKAAKTALDDIKSKAWPGVVNELLDELSACLLQGEFKKAVAIIEGFIEAQ